MKNYIYNRLEKTIVKASLKREEVFNENKEKSNCLGLDWVSSSFQRCEGSPAKLGWGPNSTWVPGTRHLII